MFCCCSDSGPQKWTCLAIVFHVFFLISLKPLFLWVIFIVPFIFWNVTNLFCVFLFSVMLYDMLNNSVHWLVLLFNSVSLLLFLYGLFFIKQLVFLFQVLFQDSSPWHSYTLVVKQENLLPSLNLKWSFWLIEDYGS